MSFCRCSPQGAGSLVWSSLTGRPKEKEMAAFSKRLLVLALVLAALGLASVATPVFPAVTVAETGRGSAVANPGGFDTGFAVSNTTHDNKGTTAQAGVILPTTAPTGACTLYNLGSTTSGGAAPPQQTSAVVPAGGQIVWGGNPAANIAATQGFHGYMMAVCQLQYAHGFAVVTDGFGGVPTIAEGYLALVVPWDGVAGGRS